MDDGIGFIVGFIFGCLVVGTIAVSMAVNKDNKWESRSVQAGHAHYRITNPTNGTTEFTWNPSCNKTNL